MKKKDSILIIAPSMLPRISSWGGSQRMYYLANYLSQSGYNIISISPKFEENKEYITKKILYNPIFLDDEWEKNRVYNKKNTLEQVKRKGLKNHLFKIIKSIKTEIYFGIVKIDRYLYNEPSCFEGHQYKKWIKKNINQILDNIDKYSIKAVIISGPSFSLFQSAKYIKNKFNNTNIIFDYRDPWHLWNCKKNIAYIKEKRILNYADFVVCFTEVFRQDLCKVFNIDIKKTKVIYNGYSEMEWSQVDSDSNDKNKKLIITYTGSIDFNDNKLNYRNPNRIIEVIKSIPENHVELIFVGVENKYKEKNSKNIRYINKVSQKESLNYMLKSDVLLNIHDTNDCSGNYLISGKFFDYMRSGKIILNIGKTENIVCKLVEKYNLGMNVLNNKESIKEIIYKLIEMKKDGTINNVRNYNEKEIITYSRENQNENYKTLIDDIIKN